MTTQGQGRTKEAIQILREARELLAVPGKWCKNSFAKDCKGKITGVWSKDAVRFCMGGAVMLFSKSDNAQSYIDEQSYIFALLLETINQQYDSQEDKVHKWNDKSFRRLDQVLTIYDLTIERLKESV